MEKSIGPINSIVLARAGESDKIYKKDQNSIELNGLCELMIKENQFMNFNDRVDYLQELSDKLFGVEYHLNDFVSTGIMYYDLLDMYNIEIFGKTYNCLMLNDEQNITQGLEENIHTDRPETSETDYKKADVTDRKINQTYLIVDKQNQKIEGVISQIGDRSEKTTTITADIDGLNSKVSNIADLTKTTSGVGTLTLDNCANGELLQLNIYGNNTVFAPLVLSDDLYLSDSLFLRDVESILIVTDEKGNTTNYNLKITDTLRQKNNVRDEYILDGGRAKIIRRINQDGSIKDNEEIEDLGELHIILEQGKSTIQIKDFSAEMQVKWAQKSDLTDTFATKVQLNTSITQTSTQIMTEVNKKVDEEELGTKIIQDYESVQVAWNKISDFIKMMVFNNNASLCIVDGNKNVIASFDKDGEHFYKSGETTPFGEMGVQTVDNKQYISFSVEGEYESDIANGMAWGIKTKSDGKFFPILYVKDFNIGAKDSDTGSGSLVLTACDIVLDGAGTGIQSGSIRIYGDPGMNTMYFLDTINHKFLMEIHANEPYLDGNNQLQHKNIIDILEGNLTVSEYVDTKEINIFDKMYFAKNQAGSNSFKIGDENTYVLFSDEGDLIVGNGTLNCFGGSVMLGSDEKRVGFSVYPSAGAWIWDSLHVYGDVHVSGNVYADNISSDKRIKNNIKDSTVKALDVIKKIKHRQFDKKNDGKHYNIGYIAQEMEEIDTNFVLISPQTEKNEERYYINELPIIATLSKAIQEQQEMIEQLQIKIKEMEEKLNEIN